MGKRLGDSMRNFSKDKLIKGISLVEALVSTAIVAIVLQHAESYS